MADLTPAPLTLEGSSVLHQMFRFRWREWRELPPWHRERIVNESARVLKPMEKGSRTAIRTSLLSILNWAIKAI